MAATNRFDAIVIGSGVSGGFAAKELTEKGLRVLMLDRGVMVEHGEGYAYDGKPAYEVPARNIMPPALVKSDYFIAKHGYVAPSNRAFYNDDRLNPYAYDEGSKFYWIRPAAVGGKSLIWGRWCFRWSEEDFEANKRDGIDGDWPIRYGDVAPWYSYVEKYIGVSGSRENLPYLPDSEFQPPIPMNVAEKWLKQNLESRFPGRKLINTRLSNMTEDKPEQNRTKCQFRNQCSNGCSFGAYFSTQAVTLPAARATGRLTLQSDAVVTSLDYDPKAKRVTGVRYIDTKTGQAQSVQADLVFLCASAMASTQILLNSRPAGSDRSHFDTSGTLGRYVMDHIFRVGVDGEIGGMQEFIEYGRRPGGVYIPRFRNIGGDDGVGFKRGYGYQGGAYRTPAAPVGFGASMKHGMRNYAPWHFSMGAFGECLPYADNHVSLHASKVDRFGVPLLRFDVRFHDNELKMMADARAQGEAMLRGAGLTNVKSSEQEHVPGDAIHEMGGARMGRDPRTSVLDAWSRAHEATNLYVTDGAQMASASCVNPSLTFMALTARAADHAVKQRTRA
ncbi:MULTISPECIES: GMC family oxidoreductase [Sphingomonas]|jgi:choline dehydrogenase-like flavoprotein|uniref:Choline dehydrogenase-like flavoprotein n=3 Tax=Sphingomonas TaxID=13687 RepID=A0A2T4YW08_9SPHN|nr:MULTISPECIES: GMC family oxidoreductase [Sphingomonas]KQM92388.1 GMC family oxidoreductase [Sphingomonas sp. Leaf226]MBB3586562.1 choline dehydrogenase-like flavoprotein [Sphingomonas sp. BK481]MBD8469630.1 GMC family oxidoreductase [Sphingomonas sp. CFBP 8765]MBD8551418.1 GMC family oxidoreductase [Sphingomonas sp. CFBP 8764]MBD8640110.1 GMC family oxidoreductase [Sphingomonas sp. CFBP 13733]